MKKNVAISADVDKSYIILSYFDNQSLPECLFHSTNNQQEQIAKMSNCNLNTIQPHFGQMCISLFFPIPLWLAHRHGLKQA